MNPSISSLNLTSRTGIQKQQMQKLKNIWQSLYDHNDSVQFRVPVNWQAYGLIDYPQIVKNPMDLGTIQSKLSNGEYLYVEDMIDELQLIWDNCKSYNLPGSWIYNLADKLEKNFKKMLKNYLSGIPFSMGTTKIFPSQLISAKQLLSSKSKGGNKRTKQKSQSIQINNEDNDQEKITYEDKIAFGQKMKYLSPENLGLVVERIMQSCPTAFSQIQNDRVQILLENIDVIAFRDFDRFISQIQEQDVYAGNKKVKTH